MIQKTFRILASAAAFWAASLTTSLAGDNPVVVELYTSQGCSSCPPADALLHQLAKRDDVIALAMHVDYWDYIGWKDQFASPAHSERQRTYAVVAGRRSVYTPEMIINGEDSIVGARGMEIADAIQKHKSKPSSIDLEIKRSGGELIIAASNSARAQSMVVHVLRFQPSREVRITRGENAGRNMSYANVVQDWNVLTEWSGRRDLSVTAPLQGDEPVVVLVQGARQGPILAAAQLR